MDLVRGTLVRLTGLMARADLNDMHALIVEETRQDNRVSVCVLNTSPIVGVNVKPENLKVQTTPRVARVRAWNDLGVAYATEKMYTRAREAFEEAVGVATQCDADDELDAQRAEACRALSNIAWLCIHMNRTGVEWKKEEGEKRVTTSECLEWAMRNLFHEILTSAAGGRASMGAGRVPSLAPPRNEEPMLMVTITYPCKDDEEEEETQRNFYYDDARAAVLEVKTSE